MPATSTLSRTVDVEWPRKVDLFGVLVSRTTYQETTAKVLEAAKARVPSVVSCHAVHAVIVSSCNGELRRKINAFDIVTPDGQPVRWALNVLYGTRLADRVYGPQLTFDICSAAAREGVSVYFYGGSERAVSQMAENLKQQIPGLVVAGYKSPPFRALTAEEDREIVREINASGAGVVFIGLGFPKQDIFAAAHQNSIHAVQVCVGAAFDFHAGTKKSAPSWMQRYGLEWLFRLSQEPRRLWQRYFVTNSIFIYKFLCAVPTAYRKRRAYRLGVSGDNLGEASEK